MKIGILVGTRPDIIKMAPLIRYCQNKELDFFILHSGQHFSPAMDSIFFQELDLPLPRYNLTTATTASYLQSEHIARIMLNMEKILLDEQPDILLVHGDTNTALAGALTAKKIFRSKETRDLSIKLGHVEAGLRSYDRSMPEEINRVTVDHLSDFLFVQTENAKNNAMKEGIPEEKIYVTGNTIVDAVLENIDVADKKKNILKDLNLQEKKYFLVTAHRVENVDKKEKITILLETLSVLGEKYGVDIIYPVHPRTKKMIDEFGLSLYGAVRYIEPLGFLEFLQLQKHAELILTDSGGVQEEACILGVPCVTLRDTTERPETLEVGSNMLAGMNKQRILNAAKRMLMQQKSWKNPFGEKGVAEKIIKTFARLQST